MSWEVWTQIGGIALVDAINFPVMLILIFVLGRPNPIANGLAYSAGMWGTHYVGGFVFAAGVSQSIGAFIISLGDNVAYIQIIVAGALFLSAAMMPRRPSEETRMAGAGARSLSGWFLAGFGITMTKLPIAVLYGTAVGRMQSEAESALWFHLGLLYYNVIAFLPFFLIWAVWGIWQERSRFFLDRLNVLIRDYASEVMKWGLMAVGVVLGTDGALRAIGYPLFG